MYPSSCVVKGCSFVNCNADKFGGGPYLAHLSLCTELKDSNISLCTAKRGGGGTEIHDSNVTGTDCEGGVEYGIVSGCRFSDCNATGSSDYGGGIRINKISVSTVRSCSFYNCHTSNYGGGIGWNNPTSEQESLTEWI